MKKINVKPDLILGVASVALGVAQVLLNNKKEATNQNILKDKLKEEIVNDLLKDKN